MQVTLSAEEVDALREVLAAALAELRSEIHHTDAAEFRERLKQRERLLLRVHEQLAPRTP
jgi:hypothetical protein